LVFHDPAVRQDSLFGRVERSCERRHPGGETVERTCLVTERMPLADVHMIEVSQVDPTRTAGAVLMVPLAFVGFALITCVVEGYCR